LDRYPGPPRPQSEHPASVYSDYIVKESKTVNKKPGILKKNLM
jgi:hypothetical protein